MFPRTARPIALLLALACGLAGARSQAASAPVYRVIVNPKNPLSEIDRGKLSDIFLKKSTHWPGGEIIRPVDLPSGSSARKSFTEEVHKRSVPAVKSYWQQLIFSGRDIPPPELETDTAVREYVLQHSGGVGYVSGSAELGNAKVISVR
jgi:ABC-type phosphate transport system substrate-binding protein